MLRQTQLLFICLPALSAKQGCAKATGCVFGGQFTFPNFTESSSGVWNSVPTFTDGISHVWNSAPSFTDGSSGVWNSVPSFTDSISHVRNSVLGFTDGNSHVWNSVPGFPAGLNKDSTWGQNFHNQAFKNLYLLFKF